MNWVILFLLMGGFVFACSPSSTNEPATQKEATATEQTSSQPDGSSSEDGSTTGDAGVTNDGSSGGDTANPGNDTANPGNDTANPGNDTSNPGNDANANEDPAMKAINEFIQKQSIDKSQSGWKTRLPMPPKLTFDAKRKYYWHMKTNKGEMKILLMPDVAPMHVSSTIYLVVLGFYNDLKFHRVITRFMAQGGDPLGTGTGGPGYKYGGEYSPSVKHDRPGLLSMANTGRPNTDGSQFFLTFVKTPWLDGKHTIFGEIKEGMTTLQALEAAGSKSGRPTQALLLEKSKIIIE